ncbi:MAG: methionyl-tRNA formyltransferase [Limnochordia bacterium]|nr:methionyl-tRNA formyltransferase [Limnochordia bacterium]MDD4517316.1 methionyl-tRNA formyltransferase [Limnochordia bacterium]
MRFVFMGTPDFSVPTLKTLAKRHEVVLVVTQPDRPRDRGQRVKPSPVKAVAKKLQIPVVQPERVSDPEFIAKLAAYDVDAIIVVAFGQKIPEEILQMGKYGCINVHASLLPKYRGAAPIQWAILKGETTTGVTVMQMDTGWDTGDILMQREIVLSPEETGGTLHDRLAALGATALIEALAGLAKGDLTPRPQNDQLATVAPKLTKERGRIQWDRPADEIERLVRAMNPWPLAYCTHRDLRLRVWRAGVDATSHRAQPGAVLRIDPQKGIAVACGYAMVWLEEVQPQARRRMGAQDYVNGYGITIGEVLGNG